MTIETDIHDTSLDRLPPQSLDSEQAVLGGLLVSGDAITRVIDLLEPEHFYRKAHQVIYAAMLDLFDKNEPIDIVTVSQYLKDDGKLENVGGRQYVTDLSLSVATTANLEYYARIVQEKALMRNLIKAGTEIVSTCYEETDADVAIDRAEHLIFSLAQRRSMQQLIHIKNIVEASFQRIEQRYENRDSLSGVPSGFYDLDALTSGFQASDLIIVAARPSMGKCLSFDSEIVLSNGSVTTIEDIYRRKDASLLTLGNDLRLSFTKPSAFVDDGIKPVYKVTTRLGRTVETTLAHPFLTISGWKRLEHISVGTKVAVPRTLPVFGTERMRECEVKLIAYLLGDGCLSNRKISFTNTNPSIQKDFLEAVSQFGGVNCRFEVRTGRAPMFMIRSDAEIVKRRREEFGRLLKLSVQSKFASTAEVARSTGITRSLIAQWQQGKCIPSSKQFDQLTACLDLDTDKSDELRRNAVRRTNQNPVVPWLQNLGLWGKDAHHKSIPPEVFRLERPQLSLFLNRLFSTDGWATVLTSGQPQLGFASVSEKLARQLQHLLLRFGVIAKLRERQVKYRDGRRRAFQLDITDSKSIEVFADQIGIFGKELAVARVRTAIEQRRRQTNCDLIPIEIWQEITLLKGNESWASLARRSNFIDCTNIHVNRRSPSRGRLHSIAKTLNSGRLLNLSQSDIYWDEVVSIEPMGSNQVYDLTVPETHNFVANDICVHNTALCLTIAQHVAIEQKIPVAVFSLEMSKEQLVQRMLCSEASIDANRLRTGHLHTNDWTHLAMAMGRLGEAPIFIDDSALLNVLEIRAKARRLKAEMKGLGLIIVDYIQLLQGRKQTDNRVQEVSEISRSLKTLAREIDVPVIALSQLSRAVEARQNKRPMLSDLRESGCLTGDSLVFLPDLGVYKPIGSLIGQDGFNVLAMNPETWRLERRQVTNAFGTGIKPIYRLKTRLGRTIRATANHKFLTITGWKRLDELTTGTRLATPRQLPSQNQATLSHEELALLGYLIGDGCTLACHAIQYTSADLDLAQHVCKLANTLFSDSILPRLARERNWYQVYLSSAFRLTHGKRNPVSKWLDDLNVFDLRSYEKFVPESVFAQPNTGIAHFLRHLWATDGTISITQRRIPIAFYATSSSKLARDVQSLLLRLSINARVRTVPQKKGRDQYHIIITGKNDLAKFVQTIGIQGERKQSAFQRVIAHLADRPANTNRDVIPIEAWKSLVEPARKALGVSSRQMQAEMAMSYCGSALFKSCMSRERAAKVASIVGSNELLSLSQSDVYWDEVISIEADGEEEVYDLTVEGLHNFVANDIVVHNSIEQDADIVMFIYRDDYYNPESERRGEAEIIIAKQRNGPTGTVDLLYQSSITRFLNKVHNQYNNG